MPSSNQESPEVRIYRETQRQTMFTRKAHNCDLCGRFATEMHEILYRSTTLNNAEARRLSFQEEICACLCKGCHANAHDQMTSMKLLNINAKLYGRKAVNAALQRVQDQLRGKLMIDLLEE